MVNVSFGVNMNVIVETEIEHVARDTAVKHFQIKKFHAASDALQSESRRSDYRQHVPDSMGFSTVGSPLLFAFGKPFQSAGCFRGSGPYQQLSHQQAGTAQLTNRVRI
jgi:hypothetical protein